MTQNVENAGVLNAFFASIFTSKTSLQESQALETREVWSREDLFLVEEDQSGNIYAIWMYCCWDAPRVLRELADGSVRPLLISELSWLIGRPA